MKLRELLNTCQNEIERYCIYFDEDTWYDLIPDVEVFNKQDLKNALVSLNRYVDAWFVDANWSLHVLLS